MAKILVRFNTQFNQAKDPALKWRVLVDDNEFLASHVLMRGELQTSQDQISTGETKWHFKCQGQISWQGTRATILCHGI